MGFRRGRALGSMKLQWSVAYRYLEETEIADARRRARYAGILLALALIAAAILAAL